MLNMIFPLFLKLGKDNFFIIMMEKCPYSLIELLKLLRLLNDNFIFLIKNDIIN